MLPGFCPASFGVLFCSVVFVQTTGPSSQRAQFLTGGVFECDITLRRYVSVRRLLYKIRCNPLHPFNDALPGPYVPVRVTFGAGTSVYLCSTSLQNLAVPHDFCYPLSVPLEWSCWPRVWWCGTGGFQEQGQCFFYWLKLLYPYYSFILCFPFSSSCLQCMLVCSDW